MTQMQTPPQATLDSPPLTFDEAQRGEAIEKQQAELMPDSGTGYADCFESSIPIPLSGGKVVNLRPLGIDDYDPWCEEMTEKVRKERLARLTTLQADPESTWRIRTNVMESEFTPDEFSPLVVRSKWAKRIITKAFENAGSTAEAAQQFLSRNPARATEMLAVRVSGLYTKTQFDRMYGRLLYGDNITPPSRNGQQPRTFGGQQPPFDDAGGNASATS